MAQLLKLKIRQTIYFKYISLNYCSYKYNSAVLRHYVRIFTQICNFMHLLKIVLKFSTWVNIRSSIPSLLTWIDTVSTFKEEALSDDGILQVSCISPLQAADMSAVMLHPQLGFPLSPHTQPGQDRGQPLSCCANPYPQTVSCMQNLWGSTPAGRPTVCQTQSAAN